MTNREIQLAIAEACGFSGIEEYHLHDADGITGFRKGESQPVEIPDYPNDLNAMRSSLMAKTKAFRLRFETLMDNYLAGLGKLWCEATASDYATIFLQTPAYVQATNEKQSVAA